MGCPGGVVVVVGGDFFVVSVDSLGLLVYDDVGVVWEFYVYFVCGVIVLCC